MSVITKLYRGETHFDFVAISKRTLKVSTAAVVVSVLIMAFLGFNLSIDFTGGVIVTVPVANDASVEEVREDLRAVGQSDARVQIAQDGLDESRPPTLLFELVRLLFRFMAKTPALEELLQLPPTITEFMLLHYPSS